MAAEGRARLVVDERPFAFRARLDVAAVAAEDDRRGAPPVDRQDRLVPFRGLERGDRRGEAAAQEAAIASSELLAEVDDLDGRPRPHGSDRERDPPIATVPGVTD